MSLRSKSIRVLLSVSFLAHKMEKIALSEGLGDEVSPHWLLTVSSGSGGWQPEQFVILVRESETLKREGEADVRWAKCMCVSTCKNVAEDAAVRTSSHLGGMVRCPSVPHLCSVPLPLQACFSPLLPSQNQMTQSPTMVCCLRTGRTTRLSS